jgi:hypothetical protein
MQAGAGVRRPKRCTLGTFDGRCVSATARRDPPIGGLDHPVVAFAMTQRLP